MASQTAHTRPQQPADSAVTSLPTETLAHILSLAIASPHLRDAVLVLRPFSMVCKHWYDVARAAGVEGEVYVANSHQAGRLAEALMASSSADRQEAIRSLVIDVEKADSMSTGSRTKRVGDLLLVLPKLQRLSLKLADSLVDPTSTFAPLGKPLCLALQSTDTLEHFELAGYSSMKMDSSNLYRILAGMPNLQHFHTSSSMYFLRDWRNRGRRLALPTTLVSIDLRGKKGTDWYSVSHIDIVNSLVEASASTLKVLRMSRASESDLRHLGGTATRALLFNLERVAGQLTELKMLDGAPLPYGSPDYLLPDLRKLTSIRRLTLGLAGIPPAERFPLFATYQDLEALRLASNEHSPTYRTVQLSYKDVLNFLAESPKLKSLKLPASHCGHWTDTEHKSIEKETEYTGIAYKLT